MTDHPPEPPADRDLPRTPSAASADDVTLDFRESNVAAERIAQILIQYSADLKAGQAPDRQQLLAAHPDLAAQLDACLAGNAFIHGHRGGQSTPQRLGEFQIVREIGRGGMGAVYEAQQESLGRRVALKVLRFGAASDQEALLRFQREAETIARLHHTNIVPIFAFGNAGGVNYYAMQFIEGSSLDRVAADCSRPIDPKTVAAWGQQAAEALAHAHARGVIHRDVKPSNLLIDGEGRVWLTDFGLAKRMGDVTLSMAGVLLGTPRYMSPEQISAATRDVDHRTDIYSLGATLYELATGQPVFSGDSPHVLIGQILSDEPVPPRRQRPDLPRDFDTILMKCLAKEPAARYESAQQLVDDLRDFQHGRPISARRVGVLGQVVRWVKRRQRSVALTASAAAVTLLLVLFMVAAGYVWHRLRLAYVTLSSDRPPLIAELLDQQGQSAAPGATVPTQQPIPVPAGEYQLRLTADRRLSQEFAVTLRRGERLDRRLNLDAQLLWDDLSVSRTYRLVRIEQSMPLPPGNSVGEAQHSATVARTDVLRLTAEGLECHDGRTGERRWTMDLRQATGGARDGGVKLLWPWDQTAQARHAGGLGQFDERPFVVSALNAAGADSATPSFDLNHDGTSDIVLALRDQPCLLAVSGVDGQPLWVAAGRHAVSADETIRRSYTDSAGGVVQPPLPVGDQNGDGVSDLVASLIHVEQQGPVVERWLELISGATGESVWRYTLPAALFALTPPEEVPEALRWFYGGSGGHSSGGGSRFWGGPFSSRQAGAAVRSGAHAYLPTEVVLVHAGGGASGVHTAVPTSLALVAGTHLILVDPATGRELESPRDLGLRTGLQPRWADLDGDGHEDLLLTAASPAAGAAGGFKTRLAAWSPSRRALLWQRDIDAQWPQQPAVSIALPAWPLLVDLDGDGAHEVSAPDGSSAGRKQAGPCWGRLVLLDGRSGQPRWHRQLLNLDGQLDHFLAGPDIDGDGIRDVYVASFWGDAMDLFVDCLSGCDGRSLWRTRETLRQRDSDASEYYLAGLNWYEQSEDGWPQLIVQARVSSHEGADRAVLLSAGTGRCTHHVPGVSDLQRVDLDGDCIADLLLFQRTVDAWDGGGQLRAVRGLWREPWRRIALRSRPVADLDGDGVRDLVEEELWQRVATHAGATGRVLWDTAVDLGRGRSVSIFPAAEYDSQTVLLPATHDLNGDGTPDVLVAARSGGTAYAEPVLWALSGGTGRPLWRAPITSRIVSGLALMEGRDLDGDGHAEVVLAAGLDEDLLAPTQARGPVLTSLWLFVLSGRTGHIRWTQPLTQPGRTAGSARRRDLEHTWLEPAYADLNGDGVLDLLLPAENPASLQVEMQALSGVDGRTLWQCELLPDPDGPNALGNVPPAVAADVDGDGVVDVAVLSLGSGLDEQGNTTHIARLSVLDGRTGQSRWHWQTPCNPYWGVVRGQADRVKCRARPVLLRRDDGCRWIALLSKSARYAIHVLDAAGQAVSQEEVQPQYAFGDSQFRLWAVDAQSDGNDELLITDAGSLRLVSPEQLAKPLWQRPPDNTFLELVLGILPNESAAGRIVVAGRGGDHSLLGLDAATGTIAWSCVAPQPHPGRVFQALKEEDVFLLNAPGADLPPHGCYRVGAAWYCRAGRVWGTVNGRAAVGPSPASERALPVVHPVGDDPRLRRPLPWKPADWELARMSRFVVWTAFYGVTLCAVPVCFLVWLVRRRQWGLRTVLMLPVAVGIALLGVVTDGPDSDFRHLAGKLALAFAGAGPVLFATIMLLRWTWQRRWRRCLTWLVVGAGVSVATMVFDLLVTGPMEGGFLLPDEQWSREGWYWIVPRGFFLWAWGTALLVPIAWLLVCMRRCYRRLHETRR